MDLKQLLDMGTVMYLNQNQMYRNYNKNYLVLHKYNKVPNTCNVSMLYCGNNYEEALRYFTSEVN